MRHLLTFMVIIGLFVVAFTIAPAITNPTGLVIAEGLEENESQENKLPNFRIYTKAECDTVSDFVICHDELFAQCGEIEYRLPNGEDLGDGIFPKDWVDPRNG
jgi:hypothetical protein|tara:strand:- start:77 stop:385 length:309 start_codon:yes stop_codon:yes gene_type:complete